MSDEQQLYLGIDVETTGLDPKHGLILEIALAICDKNLNPIERLDFVIPADRPYRWMDPYVLKMHYENGLIVDCQKAWDELPEGEWNPGSVMEVIDTRVYGWLVEHWKPLEEETQRPKDRSINLFGASVYTDLLWMREGCPRTSRFFSHRTYDVSSLKIFARDHLNIPFEKAEAHRAVADLDESIKQARDIFSVVER